MLAGDLLDHAIGYLRIKRDDFLNMTWGDYLRVCLGEIRKEHNSIRHTRLILSALTGKDARQLMPLPGDYDHLVARSKEDIDEILRIWGKTEWLNGKDN